MDVIWNPWHGCTKYTEGCAHCYVYRRDESIGKDASRVTRNAEFDLPLRKKRDGTWKIPPGSTVFACMTSDFFLDVADPWRAQAWEIIRARRDLRFCIITKRIVRFHERLPGDWGDGWEHVTLLCTCENQRRAQERLPVFLSLPLRHREIVCEPMLGPLDLSAWLGPGVARVTVGGESGPDARPMRYDWALALREQCMRANVAFHFKQTGANFIKDGKQYAIPRRLQGLQAKKANIEFDLNTDR